MYRRQPLVIASETDAVAGALMERAEQRGARLRRVAPHEVWSELGPRLEVGRRGGARNSLASRPIFNRFGASAPGALAAWRPEDRRYAEMEGGAALLAALLLHPRVINPPKPHDPSGCGLRSVEQLERAAALGFDVPAWLVTSRAEDARAFLAARPAVVFRRRSEDVFDFRRASPDALPVDPGSGRLLAPVFLLEGRVGVPVVVTWVEGRSWTVEPLSGGRCAPPAPEERLAALFRDAGLLFGQAVWVRDLAGRHAFYGMTGTPQWRFYRPCGDEVHDALLDWLGGTR